MRSRSRPATKVIPPSSAAKTVSPEGPEIKDLPITPEKVLAALREKEAGKFK